MEDFSLQLQQVPEFTFQYVSIKTAMLEQVPNTLDKFTFQYVSIKTISGISSTMRLTVIYIPICFY